MNDNRLVCTSCDCEVSLSLSYDGYAGRCACSSMGMNPGSSDRPRSWERMEDASRFKNFNVVIEGEIIAGEMANEGDLLCLKCDDGGNVTVDIDEVSVLNHDRRVELSCDRPHGVSGRPNEEIIYLNSGMSAMKLDVLKGRGGR